MFFSKSKYCGLCQCPKIAWLKNTSQTNILLIKTQNQEWKMEILLATLRFNYLDIITKLPLTPAINFIFQKWLKKTKQFMLDGLNNICEASFNYNELYCAVDILRKQNNGYAIYEVKSSTHEDNYTLYVYFIFFSSNK